jgi:hypothetical protein
LPAASVKISGEQIGRPQKQHEAWSSDGLPVPDLTLGAAIKLNTRLSLQRDLESIACPHPAII